MFSDESNELETYTWVKTKINVFKKWKFLNEPIYLEKNILYKISKWMSGM